ERRHRTLEAEIIEARAHPSIDNLQIAELKRRKLLVKDEIARLQPTLGAYYVPAVAATSRRPGSVPIQSPARAGIAFPAGSGLLALYLKSRYFSGSHADGPLWGLPPS